MGLKHIFIFLFCCLILRHSKAQFTRVFENQSIGQVLLNENGQIIAPFNGLSLLDTIGVVLWSKELIDSETAQNIDAQTECMAINKDGEFLIRSSYFKNKTNKMGISLLTTSGEVKWTKLFQLDFATPQTRIEYKPYAFFYQNNIILAGEYPLANSENKLILIITLDKNGNILKQCAFNNPTQNQGVFCNLLNNENLVIVTRQNTTSDSQNSLIHFFNSASNTLESYKIDMAIYNVHYNEQNQQLYLMGESGSRLSPKILNLSLDLDKIYSKQIILNAFAIDNSFITYTDKGILIKTDETFNNSEVFTLLSYRGEFQGAWRLPKSTDVNLPMYANDKNVFYFAFASSFSQNISNSFIAFHDPEFKNFGCYLPETCVEIEDFNVLIEDIPSPFSPTTLTVFIEDADYITVDAEMETSEPFCPDNFTPIAVPLFSSDDTICVNEMVPLINLQNVNAESVEWDIPGSTLGFSDIKEPRFSYTKPGTYSITQTVEYAGCFSDFTVEIVVAPPGELVVDTTAFLCDDSPILLDASQTFDADYLWLPDSSTNSSLLANDAGVYTVEVNDNYCAQSVDISVNNFDFNLITLDLPSDTVICEQQPLVISSSIDANASFQWNDSFPDLNRNISESGFYALTTSLDNCSTSMSINLVAEDCATQIYVPNAFSPNGDGINDTFIPLGNFFEILDFKIYNRWGGLAHDDPTQAWDGKTETKNHPLGVYVYSLKIRNTLLDEVEFLKGDILLSR